MAKFGNDHVIIDVTPTLNTNAFSDGDALFNYTEIPNAVSTVGGVAKLINITINSKKASKTPMEIILMQSAQSMEAANAAMDITAVEGAAANFLGWVDMPDAGSLDMGNFIISNPVPAVGTPMLPFLLQADAGSTSIYFTAIIGGTVTYGASDLTFRFHIER